MPLPDLKQNPERLAYTPAEAVIHAEYTRTVSPPCGEAHPRVSELPTLLVILILSVLGGIVGMQILVRLGVTPNTAIIGAVTAMILGRIPWQPLLGFRSIHRQNLVQSAISAATFGAANALLLPIGIPWALGMPDLVWPMLAGAALAMLLDAWLMYSTFGTAIFPAEAPWPPGVAAAEAIRAGDEGGRKAVTLGAGMAAGATGSWLGLPMSAIGVAFIGNPWALLFFAIGLLTRGYQHAVFALPHLHALLPGRDLAAASAPHAAMLGAGLAALVQVVALLIRNGRRPPSPDTATDTPSLRRMLGLGMAGYLGIALLLALLGGLYTHMPPAMMLGFVIFAAFAAYMHELIVGLAAMHSGWFPAFAAAVVTLLGGMIIGFPPIALALLVGFSAATGPAFGDMGCDLRAGFLLRGEGTDPAFERDGRWQQFLAAMTAFGVAIILVALHGEDYLKAGLLPPVDHVFAGLIQSGLAPGLIGRIWPWLLIGVALQGGGGPHRQLGIMFATGLLINNSAAGWAVLAGLVIRLAVTLRREKGTAGLEVLAGGLIAGDALLSFTSSIVQMSTPHGQQHAEPVNHSGSVRVASIKGA
ncbi:putative membrane spanning protein [Granulibacter bethesdensis]|uniref:OPT/YSL family transporter n=1 Tax=Granulibacter bethesdensis TaxID=364410 RepID=UPI00090942BD|nr:OPT/YSL family transporter [Granulibacter bethesdensis]APH56290.1 putative membrane spanning protein [Granulibacter bethesdensis]